MFFTNVPEAQPDPNFGPLESFKADPRPQKVDLMVGVYKDEHLRTELFDSVKKAISYSTQTKADYLPIDGLSELIPLLGQIAFGEELWTKEHSRIYGAQSIGGTSALRIGAEFLAQEINKIAFLPNYTWVNHKAILQKAGFTLHSYPYYSHDLKGFDESAMMAQLQKAPEHAIIVLHACCHNPTGCDPTPSQWKKISQVMKEKNLFPFFDFAYQGLGDGLEQDNFAIRQFVQDGHEMLVAYSCSKNFSLYCQRIGALFAVTENSSLKTKVGSQIKRIIRAMYSNPPSFGATIVTNVLKNEKNEWHADLENLRRRIHLMRESLVQRLMGKGKKRDFEHVRNHKGLVSFLDLNKSQIDALRDRFAVYVLDHGRINVAGLNMKNIDYVVQSILEVL